MSRFTALFKLYPTPLDIIFTFPSKQITYWVYNNTNTWLRYLLSKGPCKGQSEVTYTQGWKIFTLKVNSHTKIKFSTGIATIVCLPFDFSGWLRVDLFLSLSLLFVPELLFFSSSRFVYEFILIQYNRMLRN